VNGAGLSCAVTGRISFWGRWVVAIALGAGFASFSASADNWPQWLGPERDGIWRERGIVENFPTNGLPVKWRIGVNKGYCGPAVADGRVYMMDRQPGPAYVRKKGDKSIPSAAGNERVFCVDANTGSKIWEFTYDCPYRIGYPAGPRATPLVAGGRVFTLGAMGDLVCLEASDGKLVWRRQLLNDFGLTDPPMWGYAAHPLLDGRRLICTVGGSNSVVVAFDKNNGKELWRALSAREIGYAPPVLAQIHGRHEVIVWDPDALAGLEAKTGKVLWTQHYPVAGKAQRPEVTIATPIVKNNEIFVSSFYHGATLVEITNDPPGPRVVWNRHSSSSEELNDGLHTVMTTPVWRDDYIYGICGMGELRCLNALTGDRVWESDAAVGGTLGLFASAFLVQHGDEVFIWNDQGELILGRLLPTGFDEISREKLLATKENTRGRDRLWCHPAFANKCIYAQNGEELICVSLAAARS
jgi:outer membrane protein assembly factor BamB